MKLQVPPGPARPQGPPGGAVRTRGTTWPTRGYKEPKVIQAQGDVKDQKVIQGHRVTKVRQDHRGSCPKRRNRRSRA